MSILIKGMEMPKNCRICPCFQYDMFDDDIDGYCKALKTKIMNRSKHHPDCPLVEIPTPHGRLIAEKTITEIRYHDADGYHIVNGEQLCELEIDAETVIEAEGEKDER